MSTDPSLLDRFLSLECTDGIVEMLEQAINDTTKVRCHFEFNLFEVTIERDNNVVTIQDVLDDGDASRQRLSIADFATAIRR